MKTPNIYTARTIKKWDCDIEVKDLGYIPARPWVSGGLMILTRVKLAYLVFMGKCDVLDWEEVK